LVAHNRLVYDKLCGKPIDTFTKFFGLLTKSGRRKLGEVWRGKIFACLLSARRADWAKRLGKEKIVKQFLPNPEKIYSFLIKKSNRLPQNKM